MKRLTFKNHPTLVNAAFTLKKYESDIFYLVLYMLENEEETNTISFTHKQFKDITGHDLTRERFNKAGAALQQRIFNIDGISNTGSFSGADYANGVMTVEWSAKLTPYMFQMKQYVLADVKKLMAMRGVYSRRIYLMLKERKKFGKRKFVVADLHRILQTPPSYLAFRTFKNRVLNPAMKEINEFTDIKIDFEVIRNGNSAVEVEFTIRDNDIMSFEEWVNFTRINQGGDILGYAPGNKRPIKVSKKGLLYYGDGDLETIKVEYAKKLWRYFYEGRIA